MSTVPADDLIELLWELPVDGSLSFTYQPTKDSPRIPIEARREIYGDHHRVSLSTGVPVTWQVRTDKRGGTLLEIYAGGMMQQVGWYKGQMAAIARMVEVALEVTAGYDPRVYGVPS